MARWPIRAEYLSAFGQSVGDVALGRRRPESRAAAAAFKLVSDENRHDKRRQRKPTMLPG
jgi:hypothetical protein